MFLRSERELLHTINSYESKRRVLKILITRCIESTEKSTNAMSWQDGELGSPRLTMESSWFSCSVSRHLIIQSISRTSDVEGMRLRLSEEITLDASIDKAPA